MLYQSDNFFPCLTNVKGNTSAHNEKGLHFKQLTASSETETVDDLNKKSHIYT